MSSARKKTPPPSNPGKKRGPIAGAKADRWIVDDPFRVLDVGARVEVSVLTYGAQIPNDRVAPGVSRPAFGRVVALDQVAVVLDGELEPRAFAPSTVKVIP